MEHHTKTVKHVREEDDLYTLFVYRERDRHDWTWLVTHTDMSNRTLSHKGQWLHSPKRAQAESVAWKEAEVFLAGHRKTRPKGA